MSLNVRGRTRAAVLLAIGIVAGGALSTTIGAYAADTGSGAASSSSDVAHPGPRGGGTPLTGDAAQKVKDAVIAKYAGATINDTFARPDGTYEAHLTKTDGTRTDVLLDKNYTVTGEETGHGGPGGCGGPGGGGPGGGGPGGRGHGGPGGPPAGGPDANGPSAASPAPATSAPAQG
jgi:hypothetical protein